MNNKENEKENVYDFEKLDIEYKKLKEFKYEIFMDIIFLLNKNKDKIISYLKQIEINQQKFKYLKEIKKYDFDSDLYSFLHSFDLNLKNSLILSFAMQDYKNEEINNYTNIKNEFFDNLEIVQSSSNFINKNFPLFDKKDAFSTKSKIFGEFNNKSLFDCLCEKTICIEEKCPTYTFQMHIVKAYYIFTINNKSYKIISTKNFLRLFLFERIFFCIKYLDIMSFINIKKEKNAYIVSYQNIKIMKCLKYKIETNNENIKYLSLSNEFINLFKNVLLFEDKEKYK